MTDHELLHRYVQEGAQDAFSELVRRHVDLVYSAARRQVQSTQLAEEIAQSVFVDLARNARCLRADQPLGAWLYVVTRRTAVDVIRRESRRQAREQAAVEIAAMNFPSSPWPHVEPLLDEAMESLGDADRRAVLLRFFENQPLRDVGLALGVSEDAAQKRISRALEQLRVFFTKRGVAIASVALAAELSAHAVQAAPAGLTALLSAAATTANLSGAAALQQAAQALVMTTAQKTLATLAIAAALGLALYEGIPTLRLHRQVQDGQQRLDRLADTDRQLRLEQTAAARELARLAAGHSGAPPMLEPGSDAALAWEAAAWFARIERVKQVLAQHPELATPELQLLTDRDWISAARGLDFSREESTLSSLRLLRIWAKRNFTTRVSDAVRKYYAAAHALPDQFGHLAPSLNPPIDPAILARYNFQNENGQVVIAEKFSGAVDPDRLALLAAADSGAKRGLDAYIGYENVEERSVREAAQAYARSHNGARPTDPAQLLPFLARPIDPATLTTIFGRLPLSHLSTVQPKS